jgi:hypothetical protein
MTIPLTRLASKQKRASDWNTFLTTGGVAAPGLKARMEKVLGDFQNLLTAAWREKTVTDTVYAQILDLERQLETLNEDARCSGSGYTPTVKDGTFVP